MCGITPWGGFGAICTPELIARQEGPFASCCDGGYIYTEGIFDDINKVLILGNYKDRNCSYKEILTDYGNYEYSGIDADDFIRLVNLIEATHLCTNSFDCKPCNLEDCDAAWELAEKLNSDADSRTREYWKWRIVYIRAYLDKVRYHRCAECGWPLEKPLGGWMLFWRKFLEHDGKSQEMLLELVRLYKAQLIDDADKYAYHWFVRPPLTYGADLELEKEIR